MISTVIQREEAITLQLGQLHTRKRLLGQQGSAPINSTQAFGRQEHPVRYVDRDPLVRITNVCNRGSFRTGDDISS
jgi:hypothetical protein